MCKSSRRQFGMLLMPLVWAALCMAAPAQVVGHGQQNNVGNFPGMFPGQTGMFPGQAGGLMNSPANQIGLTPQMQQYMMLRALQGRGTITACKLAWATQSLGQVRSSIHRPPGQAIVVAKIPTVAVVPVKNVLRRVWPANNKSN